jgi:hypothetical protein
LNESRLTQSTQHRHVQSRNQTAWQFIAGRSITATLESNSHEHSPYQNLHAHHWTHNAGFEPVPITRRAEAPSAPRRSPVGAVPVIWLRVCPWPRARPGSGCDEQCTETLAGQAAVRRWWLPNPSVRLARRWWRRWWWRRNVRSSPNRARRRPIAVFLKSIRIQ